MEEQGILESVNQVRGFFCLHLRAVYTMQGGFAMTASEQAYCKLTLFQLKDWDSFQIALRGCLRRMQGREIAQGVKRRPERE